MDYAARGQVVRGNCRSDGCSRRVTIDPDEMVKAGLAPMYLRTLKTLWRCQRIASGCGLEWHNEPPRRPLRLGHLTGKAHVRVKVACAGKACKFSRRFVPEQLIAGLIARGQGDEATEVDKLGAMMTAGCPVCGKANWRVHVLVADTQSMSWRDDQERTFDRLSGYADRQP